MRTYEFGDLTTEDGCEWTANCIAAYLSWPEKASRRAEYLTSRTSVALALLDGCDELLNQPPAPEFAADSLPEAALRRAVAWSREQHLTRFDVHGGHWVVATAPGLPKLSAELAAGVKNWATAGVILEIIGRLDTHHRDVEPSVNKAVHLVEVGAPRGWWPLDTHANPKDIRRAWTSHKSVAPLAAAVLTMLSQDLHAARSMKLDELPKPGPFDGTRLLELLGRAAACERFALGFVQPRAGQRLLHPANPWRMPADGPWPELTWSPAPLSEAGLAALREYRPPKRF